MSSNMTAIGDPGAFEIMPIYIILEANMAIDARPVSNHIESTL